jgi:hypothetical protein
MLLESLEPRLLLATFLVQNANDSGPDSLRDAIAQANTRPGTDTIEFSPELAEMPIGLTSGEITIDDSLFIYGLGRDLTVIDAQQNSRIFNVTDTAPRVVFGDLTLTGGRSAGPGGAIFAHPGFGSFLTLADATVTGNQTEGDSSGGAGIYSARFLTLTRSVISENETWGVGAQGGGVFAEYVRMFSSTISGNKTHGLAAGCGGLRGAEINMDDSQVIGNRVEDGPGGGLCGQIANIALSTISGNVTVGDGGWGGGLYAQYAEVIDSTINDNKTYGYYSVGGGVFALNQAFILQSTISANQTQGRYAHGAGVGTYGTAFIQQSTITGNELSGELGSVGAGVFANQLVASNSIVARNTAVYGAGIYDQDLYFDNATIDHSLIGSNRSTNLQEAPVGSPDAAGNFVGDSQGSGVIDPQLEPLADNGGLTRTHRLLGGPAIDSAGALISFHDQRGTPFLRDRNGGPDMGAYEVQALPPDLGDGFYDCSDIDTIVAQIASGFFEPLFDFTGNGALNLDDVAFWLAAAGSANLPTGAPYLFGDANLDGTVDGQDFILWNSNKFTAMPKWCAGDFDADGFVDGSDFIVWNQNKFSSSDAASLPSVTVNQDMEGLTNKTNSQLSPNGGLELRVPATPLARPSAVDTSSDRQIRRRFRLADRDGQEPPTALVHEAAFAATLGSWDR